MKSITTPITWINALTRHVHKETCSLPPWLIVERLNAVDDGTRREAQRTESTAFGNWRVMTYIVGRGVVAYLVPAGYEILATEVREAIGGGL